MKEIARLTKIEQDDFGSKEQQSSNKMILVKDSRKTKNEGQVDRRELYNLCEILFNLGSSKSLIQEYSVPTLSRFILPLKNQFEKNLEEIVKSNNKM